jgi:hypothetical protein
VVNEVEEDIGTTATLKLDCRFGEELGCIGGQQLCTLFPCHWQEIVATNESKPAWETITKYPLRSRVLWQRWQDPTQLVGVRFGSATWYALIDIDIQSPYGVWQPS